VLHGLALVITANLVQFGRVIQPLDYAIGSFMIQGRTGRPKANYRKAIMQDLQVASDWSGLSWKYI